MEGANNGNWRSPQGDPVGVMNPEAPPSSEWRSQLQPEARQRIVTKIVDTLKKHLPISGPDGLNELRKIAVRFEERVYTAAASQVDYLRKISMKMVTMEQKAHGAGAPDSVPTNSNLANHSPDTGCFVTG